MSDESKTKRTVTLELDPDLLQRIENTIHHIPPGWDVNRVFEVGAVELLQRLELKWNQGKPFPNPES